MRTFCPACLLAAILAGPAGAADFARPAPVQSAVFYLQGIALTRIATVDLPVGRHRVLVPALGSAETPTMLVDGAALGSVVRLDAAMVDAAPILTEAQRQAVGALDAAEDALQEARDARAAALSELDGAEARLAFLRSVEGGALSRLEPEAIAEAGTTLAREVADAAAALARLRASARATEAELDDARTRRDQARRDVEAGGAPTGPVDLLAVTVEAEEAGPVEIRMRDFASEGGWSIAYDADLAAGAVTLTRKAVIRHATGLAMDGIALRLSTADPYAATAPSPVFPDLATIGPEIVPLARGQDLVVASEAMVRMPEPIVAAVDTDGPVVAYDYPRPVDLPADGAPSALTLDRIELPARAVARAVPRRDATAFLVAEVSNPTAEPILPGPATLSRDGEIVGEAVLTALAAGAEGEIAFGPLPHLALEFRVLENETGDRGLFVTSGTRRQDMVFRVRNLSDAAEQVEALFALPYSEQQVLDVTVTTTPEPTARDMDEAQGVARWDLEVPPGRAVEVRIGVTLEWPEGERLIWQP